MGQNPIQQKKREERDKKIYRLYWDAGLTYRDLAEEFHISFERIRQIIKKKGGKK